MVLGVTILKGILKCIKLILLMAYMPKHMAEDALVAQWAYLFSEPSSILTRSEIFSTVDGVPLLTAFHYHPNIVLI